MRNQFRHHAAQPTGTYRADLTAPEHLGQLRTYLANRRSEAEADDILQETLMRALIATRRDANKTWSPAWIRGIARHIIYRSIRAAPVESLDVLLERDPESEPADSSTSPLDSALTSETLGAVRKGLTELASCHAEIIVWHYFEGLSVAEMAKRCGRTKKSTEKLIGTSLAKLRRAVRKHECC
jgi:RNA polymerase sigma factor (sigma-70 family)